MKMRGPENFEMNIAVLNSAVARIAHQPASPRPASSAATRQRFQPRGRFPGTCGERLLGWVLENPWPRPQVKDSQVHGDGGLVAEAGGELPSRRSDPR